MTRPPPTSTLFPYTTLFRSNVAMNLKFKIEDKDGKPAKDVEPYMGMAGHAEIVSADWSVRSEEHTSELQSHVNLVCRLLLEKKKQIQLEDSHSQRPAGPRNT